MKSRELYDNKGTDPVHSTVNFCAASKTTLNIESEKHAFVKRIQSDPGFEEITHYPRRLSTPTLLDLGRRTWIERTGKIAISIFCLDSSYAGYADLVHGGILAALVDECCAEYCNRGALSLYPLTKHLGVEFERPSPTGGIFIARVSTSRSFPLTTRDSRKVWVECRISVLRGGHRMIPVVKATALFILCEKLPQLPSCGEVGDSIEDLFTSGEDDYLYLVARVVASKGKRSILALTVIAFAVALWSSWWLFI